MGQEEAELLVCTAPQVLCGSDADWAEHVASAEGRYLSDWNDRMCALADYSPDPPDCMVVLPNRRPDFLAPPGYAHPPGRRDAGIRLHAGETLADVFGEAADFVRRYASNGEDFANRYAAWESRWRASRACDATCDDLTVWFPIACGAGAGVPWPAPAQRQRIVVPEMCAEEICVAREALGSDLSSAAPECPDPHAQSGGEQTPARPAPQTPNNVCSATAGIIDGRIEWAQHTLANCQSVRLMEIIATYSVTVSAELKPQSVYRFGDGQEVRVGCQYGVDAADRNLTVDVGGNEFLLDATGSLQVKAAGSPAFQPAHTYTLSDGVLGGPLARARMEFSGKEALTSFDMNVTVNTQGEIVTSSKTKYTVTVRIGSLPVLTIAVAWEARVHVNPALEVTRNMQCVRIRDRVPQPVLRRVRHRSVREIITDGRFIIGAALLGLGLLLILFPPAALVAGAAAVGEAGLVVLGAVASTEAGAAVAAAGVAVAIVPLAAE